jgi:formamidopyrimidine-DNA glycosylase
MPELAEVEFFRRRWALAATGAKVQTVEVHERAKIFRGTDPAAIVHTLTGATLRSSETAAKQMLFRFSGNAWLGIHLGMSGDLAVAAPDVAPKKHDHLILRTRAHALVFSDPRMFGRVQFSVGAAAPTWWSGIAPAILSPAFTVAAVTAFLRRRARAPIKAVLLMQERFPGVGNWMADEILWRAELYPGRRCGSLTPAEIARLWKECRTVCRLALKVIAGTGNSLPGHLNQYIPKTWLMPNRWSEGGKDPKTGETLLRGTFGGRTTVWSPAVDPSAPPRSKSSRAKSK